jgi:spore coat polysaccharide biosynthesis predicted glycosyltransferase SpsG
MDFVFRADASLKDGTGHVMRLYAIAEEAIGRGINCTFVGNFDEVPWLSKKVRNLGFQSINPGPSSITAMAPHSALILDSYTVPINDNFIKNNNWKYFAVLADKQTPKYDCQLAIHPGLLAEWGSRVFKNFLSGPDFVAVRKEILDLKTLEERPLFGTSNILVVAGGTDPFNFSEYLAKVLSKVHGNFQVVFFTKNPEKVVSLDKRFVGKVIGSELIDELKKADLVITSASTSSLEFLALNKNVAVCCLIENQFELYKYLVEKQICPGLGIRRDQSDNYILLQPLNDLIENLEMGTLANSSSRDLVDGNGAKRIVDLFIHGLSEKIEDN